MEFSKPAHTRPQMLRTQALIIIQNWTFKLTYSPPSSEKDKKKKPITERKNKRATLSIKVMSWGQPGDVGSQSGLWDACQQLAGLNETRRDRKRQAGRRCQADRSQASGSFLTCTITHNLFHFISRQRE